MARHNRTTVDLSAVVPSAGVGLREYMRAVEGDLVAEAFKLADGHRPTVAKLLRVSERALRHLIAKHLRVRPRSPVASRRSPVASALIVALAVAVSAARVSSVTVSATTAARPAAVSTSIVAARPAIPPAAIPPDSGTRPEGESHATH